jgi:hypothetical protein
MAEESPLEERSRGQLKVADHRYSQHNIAYNVHDLAHDSNIRFNRKTWIYAESLICVGCLHVYTTYSSPRSHQETQKTRLCYAIHLYTTCPGAKPKK